MPITGPVAALGNRIGIKQKVSDNGDNYDQIHIGEVIDSKNNDQRKLYVITGRLQKPVNRQ